MIALPRRFARLPFGAGESSRAEIGMLQRPSKTRFTCSEGGSSTFGACFSAAC
jgi:hypothetical protein